MSSASPRSALPLVLLAVLCAALVALCVGLGLQLVRVTAERDELQAAASAPVASGDATGSTDAARDELAATLAEARALLEARDAAGALAKANWAVQLDAASVPARIVRARARTLAHDDRLGALADLDGCLAEVPHLAALLAARARIGLDPNPAYGADPPAEDLAAEQDARRALALDEGQPDAHLALALLLHRRRQVAEALRHSGRAIELAPRMQPAYMLRGRLSVLARDPETALEDFTLAAELEPEDPEALTNLGALLQLHGEGAAARAKIERALELDPKSAPAQFALARLHASGPNKDREAAIRGLSLALTLQPDFAEAYLFRAAVYLDARRTEDALRDLDEAHALRRSWGFRGRIEEHYYFLLRGHCLFLREDWPAAEEAYARFLELAPADSRSRPKVEQRLLACRAKRVANPR